MRRKIHQAIDMGLTFLGLAIILATLLAANASLQLQLMWAVVGVLFIEAGVWGTAQKLTPNERAYGRLREEGDRMLRLIRQLNGAAVARSQGLEDDARFHATLEEMHATVRLMAELAGQRDELAQPSGAASRPAADVSNRAGVSNQDRVPRVA